MEMQMQTVTGELARIFLKNGQNFFGILLNDLESTDSIDSEIRFVKPSNISTWKETSDEGLVEILDSDHVEGIDLFLK